MSKISNSTITNTDQFQFQINFSRFQFQFQPILGIAASLNRTEPNRSNFLKNSNWTDFRSVQFGSKPNLSYLWYANASSYT